MKQLFVFCVESQNSQHDSDGLYIKQALNYYYHIDQHKMIIRFVYMKGKHNYAKKQIKNQLDRLIRQLEKQDSFHIFYVCDKDEDLQNSQDREFAEKIEHDCEKWGYSMIWMNRNIEEVFWGKQIENNEKVKAAIQFKTSGQIVRVCSDSVGS